MTNAYAKLLFKRLVRALPLLALVMFWSVARSGGLYVTWAGAEVDKGACAWYIKRKVDPQATIQVVPHGERLPEGLAFDVPQSDWRRTHNASAFQSLLRSHPDEDPIIQHLAALTHDIEINLWRPKVHAESVVLEQRVRDIEAVFAPDGIPMECFVLFFDGVYNWLRAEQRDPADLKVPESCQPSGE